jgi:hypothetical protein
MMEYAGEALIPADVLHHRGYRGDQAVRNLETIKREERQTDMLSMMA